MKTLHGTPASPGTAVAPAYVYAPDVYPVPDEPQADEAAAIASLEATLGGVADALDDAASRASGAAGEILRAQSAMARDPALLAAAVEQVRAGRHPARAILDAGERFADELERTGNEILAGRAPDVRHICDLAARKLSGAPPRTPPHPEHAAILIAPDLTPADTAGLSSAVVRGIVTSGGTRTSHTVVVARGMGIPAVVGVRDLLDIVEQDEQVAVDGTKGDVIVEPDAQTIQAMWDQAWTARAEQESLRVRAGSGPTATADGKRIEVAANIAGVEELRMALGQGAEAVGLLRTELLYIDRSTPPPEAEQIELLAALHDLLGPKRLVVRTFDIGSDKPVPFLPVRPERNPELGVRGIRLARAYPDLLQTQLRAVAATAHLGPTAVMAPMIATFEDAAWFVEACAQAGVPRSVEVGVMAEVPSLVLQAREVAELVGFISIGTNDLAQYLHAADRRAAALEAFQDPFDPALLRAVEQICAAAAGRCWVGVCGEAASDPLWALTAVGLGVTELSMQGIAVAAVRAALRGATLERCRAAASRATGARSAGDARAAAREALFGGDGS